MNLLSFIATRFSEPSSYAGVAAMAGGIHMATTGSLQTGLITFFGGLAALLAPEGATPTVPAAPKS